MAIKTNYFGIAHLGSSRGLVAFGGRDRRRIVRKKGARSLALSHTSARARRPAGARPCPSVCPPPLLQPAPSFVQDLRCRCAGNVELSFSRVQGPLGTLFGYLYCTITRNDCVRRGFALSRYEVQNELHYVEVVHNVLHNTFGMKLLHIGVMKRFITRFIT